MGSAHSIPLTHGIFFISLSAIPIFILARRGLFLWRDLLISIGRMLAQLLAIGVYLQYIFKLNSPYVNCAWLFVMIAIATTTILKRASLRRRVFFKISFVAIATSAIITGVIMLLTVGVQPLYDAPYLIPMMGMVLGNSIQANVISLERFYTSLRDERDIYELSLFNGATRQEALQPFINRALTAAISPSIAGMMTMGLVSLPGMMTGQILGGSVPLEAIKYQIIIVIAIFLALFFSVFLNLLLSPRVSFNETDVLREDIFR